MSLTRTGIGCMPSETGPLCNLRKEVAVICPQEVPLEENTGRFFHERELSSGRRRSMAMSFLEDKSYSANSFHLCGNEWLAFCFLLVASSYMFLIKNVNFLCDCRIESAEKISSPERTIANADTENEANSVTSPSSGCSESSVSSYGFSSSTKCDSSSEISDLDRASYWDSLLSLEEEDSEWLSDSKSFNSSTPLSSKCETFSQISEIDAASYWDSLLSIEGKNSEWISDSKLEFEYFEDGFPSPSYESSWGTELLSCVSTISSLTGVHSNRSESEDDISVLLENADMEEVSAYDDDEPLFWPYEGKFNWNSEESCDSFCTSPRRRLVFDSEEVEQKRAEAACSVKSETSRLSMWPESSAMIATMGSEDEEVVLKPREVPSNKMSLGKIFLIEDFALDQELPIETLVGLGEFDGHEGIDSEFNGDVFMLDEFLYNS